MSKLFTFKCDVCGKIKGETNHWFVLLLMPRKIEVLQLEENWSKAGATHVCGSGCAMKRISERMAGESFAADALPVELREPENITTRESHWVEAR